MKKSLLTLIVTLSVLLVCVCLLPTQVQAASTSDLTFLLQSDGKSYIVLNCEENAIGDLVIPSTYNGLPVTSIAPLAFKNCTGLTVITIPDSVTNIGFCAFEYCTGLTNIIVPDSVTRIGYSAFRDCTSLIGISIPDSVIDIGHSMFYGCTNLSSITLSANITSIGASSFYGCTSLTTLTIPDGVTSIDNYAFYDCTNLTIITIPISITSIGNSAFECCDGLTTVFYAGTRSEKANLSVGSKNADFTANNVWHYGCRKIFDNQRNLYCPECERYYLPSGQLWVSALGDMNFDEYVSDADAMFLLRYTLFPDRYPLNQGGDMNGDNQINDADAMYLLRHTLFPERYPLLCDSRRPSGGLGFSKYNEGYYLSSTGTCPDTDIVIPAIHKGLPVVGISEYFSSTSNNSSHAVKSDSITSIYMPNSITDIGSHAFFHCINLTSIVFDGTKQEWRAITKGDNWYYVFRTIVVTCTDGSITYS